jgi:hypothetical protein
MAKLAAFLGRQRRAVALLVGGVACRFAPRASDQTSELTGGGFDVPGIQSTAASDAIARHFPSRSDPLGVVLHASPGAGAADRAAYLRRVERAAAQVEHLWLPRGRRLAKNQGQSGRGPARATSTPGSR